MSSVCTPARSSGSGRQHHGQRPPCSVNTFTERVGDSRPSMRQLYGLPLTFPAAMIASMDQRGGKRRAEAPSPRLRGLAGHGVPAQFRPPARPGPVFPRPALPGLDAEPPAPSPRAPRGPGSGVTRRAHCEGVPFVLAQACPGTTQREAGLRVLGLRELCPVCQAFDPCRFLPVHPLTGLR
jgi:hypothetical protein